MATRRLQSQSDEIPEEFFHALAYLIPGLSRLAEKECGLTLTEWTVLWHLQNRGNSDGTMLRQELTTLLTNRGFTNAAVTKIVDALQRKGLVRRISLTPEERKMLFGTAEGAKLAVTLSPEGNKRITKFKVALAQTFTSWRSEQQPWVGVALKTAERTGARFAAWLLHGQG